MTILQRIKNHLREYGPVYAIPTLFAGLISSSVALNSTIERQRIDDVVLRHFSNRTEMIRPINALHDEVWIDEGNDGNIDTHYQRIDSLRPYLFGLSILPMEVKQEDQDKYRDILTKS